MPASEWNITKSNHMCLSCSCKFREGEAYFSILYEIDSRLERRDYCPECIQNHRSGEVFSFWKTSVPEEASEQKGRSVLDLESVMEFFRRLEGEEAQERVAFRFVLALMLSRKKILNFKGTERGKNGKEKLVFGQKGGIRHEVLQPDLNEDEISAVSDELGRLLGIAPPRNQQGGEEDVHAAKGGGVFVEAGTVGESDVRVSQAQEVVSAQSLEVEHVG